MFKMIEKTNCVNVESAGPLTANIHSQFLKNVKVRHSEAPRQTLMREIHVQSVMLKHKEALVAAQTLRENMLANEKPCAVPSHLTHESLLAETKVSDDDLFFIAAKLIHDNAHEEPDVKTYGQMIDLITADIMSRLQNSDEVTFTQQNIEEITSILLKEDLVKQGYASHELTINLNSRIINYKGEIMTVAVDSGGASIIAQSAGDSPFHPSVYGYYMQDTTLMRAQNIEKMRTTGTGRHHLFAFQIDEILGKHPQDVRQFIQDATGARTLKHTKKLSEMDQKEYESYATDNPMISCVVNSGQPTRINYGLNYKHGVASPLQVSRYHNVNNYKILSANEFPCVNQDDTVSHITLDYTNPRAQLIVKGGSAGYPIKDLHEEVSSFTTVQKIASGVDKTYQNDRVHEIGQQIQQKLQSQTSPLYCAAVTNLSFSAQICGSLVRSD